MFTMRKVSFFRYLVTQARYKSKTHWSKQKKKNSSKDKALSHFDDFYGSVFGEQWDPIREAMLRRCKYVAVVNNFGDAEETMEFLTNRGAHCLKKLMQVQKDFNDQYSPPPVPTTRNQSDSFSKLDQYAEKLQADEISNLYHNTDNIPDRLDTKEMTLQMSKEVEEEKVEAEARSKTLEESIADSQFDTSRIIDPSMGLTSEALYQYIPATKLKGMDDWVPESVQYSFLTNNKYKDFPLVIEPETDFKIPEHLKVFTYEMDSEWTMFPEPKRCQTGVYNYYPMDCGSVLSALALCLSPGERVLDLCSAPGGKALVCLQTLLPGVLVCNDSSISRSNRLRHILSDYLYDFQTSNKWRERVILTQTDGRSFIDEQGFDKVLVDVPCTTDRLSVTRIEDNSIFRQDRVRERLRLPELQSQLLAAALSLVRPGGAVVYSTCSLSPAQNDGAVHVALKHAFETRGILAAVRDLTPAMAPLSSAVKFARGAMAPRYGQLVIPSLAANFGPTYFARLVRLK